jgi:4-amino-4-deoxy-L-arabinose transferase-like glycosyltransferase
MQALASILLLTGAWLFGAWAREPALMPPRLEFPPSTATAPPVLRHDRPSLAWLGMHVRLAVSLLLAVLACALFIRDGENQFLRLVWLASIAVLLIAPLNNIRVQLPRIAPQERVYVALLGVLLVITLVTRVYDLAELPYNVDGDFADVGLQARALASGQEQRIFAYGWAQVPMLGYLPAWLTLKLFGDSLVGLNASGVIEGLLLIVGVYLLGRDLFHARVGLFAAAVLTVSWAHLAASRQSSYIDPVLFLLFALYFLLLGLREGRSGAVILSGVLTALCIQMYYSGRLVGFIVAFLLLYLFLFRRAWLRERWSMVLLWVFAILITLGPMLFVFASSPDGFITRARFVFIFNPDAIRHLEGAYHVDSVAGVLLEQARRTMFLFHYYPDTGTQFGLQRPYLDPILATLFTLGAGYAVLRRRWFGDALLLGWLILGMLLGSFLTLDPPFWTRLMILLPPTALLIARALDILYAELTRLIPSAGTHKPLLAAALSGIVLAGVGVMNWNTYVLVKGVHATEVTRIGRYLAAQPPSVRGFLVSEKFPYDVRQLQFIAPGRLVGGLQPAGAEGAIARVGSPTLLILTDEQAALAERLPVLYPGGSSETHLGNTPNEIAFFVFWLP